MKASAPGTAPLWPFNLCELADTIKVQWVLRREKKRAVYEPQKGPNARHWMSAFCARLFAFANTPFYYTPFYGTLMVAPLPLVSNSGMQGGSGTESESETGTVTTVFPETESWTGPAGTISKNQNQNRNRPFLLNCTEVRSVLWLLEGCRLLGGAGGLLIDKTAAAELKKFYPIILLSIGLGDFW